MVGADLGLGADHDHVEVAQGLAQLIGLIELLDDLVAHLAQLRHRGLIHTVSNQNTHGNYLLLYYSLLWGCDEGSVGAGVLDGPHGVRWYLQRQDGCYGGIAAEIGG